MAAHSAASANTAQLGDVGTVLEDIDGYIRRIDPADSPLYNLCRDVDATQVETSWEVEELPTARNEAEEIGAEYADEAASANTLIKNQCQLHIRTGSVSHTSQATATNGGVDDLVREVTKKSLVQRNDIELSLIHNTPYTAGDTPVAAGLSTYITNTSLGATGVNPAGTGADAATPGTGRTLTLAMITDAMEAAFNDGGRPNIAMMGATLKRVFSGLSGVASNEVNLSANNGRLQEAMLIGSVSSYLTDFGQVDVIVNRHMNGARGGSPAFGTVETIYLISPDYIDVAFIPGMKYRYEERAKTGSAYRFALETQACLRVTAPKAHAAVHAVTA